MDQMKPSNITFLTAGGGSEAPMGVMKGLPIRIGSLELKIDAMVTPDLPDIADLHSLSEGWEDFLGQPEKYSDKAATEAESIESQALVPDYVPDTPAITTLASHTHTFEETVPELPPLAMVHSYTEDLQALDSLERRSRALLDITNSKRFYVTEPPLRQIMTELQAAMHDPLTGSDAHSEASDPVTSGSPLPQMMADLQLAMDDPSDVSYAGSADSDPSSLYESAIEAEYIPIWQLQKDTGTSGGHWERPGLYEFQHQQMGGCHGHNWY